MNITNVIDETINHLEVNNYIAGKIDYNKGQLVKEIREQYLKNNFSSEENKYNLETIEIKSRRYLGSKTKLVPFIKKIVKNHCGDYNSFFDVFGGTGVVSSAFNNENIKIIINDLLNTNYKSYKTWFDNSNYDIDKIKKLLIYFNQSNPTEENYVSKHFGNKFFTYKDSIKIGFVREKIREFYKNGKINDRERDILITSLIYALDKIANTCGHYDAYRKKLDECNDLELFLPDITDKMNKNNEIFNMDANELVKFKQADIVYIDPPYNSRQYSDTYHLLENITEWKKPEVTGKAQKMVDRSHIKSNYCTVKAPEAFEELIKNINAKYILVSYSNMGEKGVGRSQAKISDVELKSILEEKGETRVFNKNHKVFTTGKSNIEDHKERIFLCKPKKKSRFFIKEIIDNENMKSPMNYTGGKYKLLPQLKEYFPKKIDTFYDIFTGGVNVGINIKANKIICLESQKKVLDIYKQFKNKSKEEVENKIDQIIDKYNLSNTYEYSYEHYNTTSSKGLSKYNKKKFEKLRDDFNNYTKDDSFEYSMMFLTLIIYSFNNQIRFNNDGNYNMPVNKRDFNGSLRKRMRKFVEEIKNKNINFLDIDFRNLEIDKINKNDFVYLDPPYLIGTASYNENGGWTKKDELDLYKLLNELNEMEVKFALSNVIKHKNKENKLLNDFIKENNYCINYLNFNYNNSNYQQKHKDSETIEVLITNY